MSTDTAFGDLIATVWEQRVQCEMPTQAGARCRRDAHWRINLHGCEQALTCGQHKTAWTQQTSRHPGPPRCAHCHHTFDRAADAYTVSAL